MTDRSRETGGEFEFRLTTALREYYGIGDFPRTEIERELRDTLTEGPKRSAWLELSTVRSLVAAVAAVLLFVGGAEYGRHLARPAGDASTLAAEEDHRTTTPDLPLAIQTSGSRYVATLATLTEQAPHLSERQLRIGREVAITTLYAAAVELLGIDREDDVLQETVRGLAAGTVDFASIDGQ